MSAVSSTCTRRKKKMATPVMRCSTHDHMPSRPRYRVPRGTFEVVSATESVERASVDTVVLPARCEVAARRRGPCAGAVPSYDRADPAGTDGEPNCLDIERVRYTCPTPRGNRRERACRYPGGMPEPIEDFYAVIPAGGIGSR